MERRGGEKMVKKTKKASKQFFDNVIEYEGEFDFPSYIKTGNRSAKSTTVRLL